MNSHQFCAAMSRAAATALLLMSSVGSAQAPQCATADYDAVRDFSIQSNPNGVWSYGWESTLGTTLNLYTVRSNTCHQGISEWAEYEDCNAPIVAHNDTDKNICYRSWCVLTTYLWFHPGPNGELTVVRWTAPFSGRFLIEGQFMGIDSGGPTTTDVHVLVNSKNSLLNGPITSYKWPLVFKFTVSVAAGATVDFAVGFGQNLDYHYDSTGVRFTVKRLGP